MAEASAILEEVDNIEVQEQWANICAYTAKNIREGVESLSYETYFKEMV